MNRLTKISIVLVLIWMTIAANNMAFQDALDQGRTYRQNVCAGVWPDYENLNLKCETTDEQ